MIEVRLAAAKPRNGATYTVDSNGVYKLASVNPIHESMKHENIASSSSDLSVQNENLKLENEKLREELRKSKIQNPTE